MPNWRLSSAARVSRFCHSLQRPFPSGSFRLYVASFTRQAHPSTCSSRHTSCGEPPNFTIAFVLSSPRCFMRVTCARVNSTNRKRCRAYKLSQLLRCERTAGRWISDHEKEITRHFLLRHHCKFIANYVFFFIKNYIIWMPKF